MIKAINISSLNNSNYYNNYGNIIQNISNINKLNIFIGENNSGKSRMMRYLINGKNARVMLDYIPEEKKNRYNGYLEKLKLYITKFNSQSSNLPTIKIENKLYELEPALFYCEIQDYIESLNLDSYNLNPDQKSCYSSIQSILKNIFDLLITSKDSENITILDSFDITYIPILRGIENFNNYYQLKETQVLDSVAMTEIQRNSLNEFKEISKHIYEKKISKTYAIDAKKIFTAENLFDEIISKLLGQEEDRSFIRDFENFISKEFYHGDGFNIIPQYSKGYLSVKIGNSIERPLHDLGDGIKQLITILYKIYEKKSKEALFFIEEPEQNLHPGYQRRLIEILQNNEIFSKHQYFITTHSNHIIDKCFDYNNISIYKFININESNDSFQIINTTNNDVEILNLLGVQNSSIFVANCAIWVEGISDKILLSKYLSVYMEGIGEKKYKEDIHYAFIEYGGNNITHWAFIDDNDITTINSSGITNRNLIVLDNDNDSKLKRKKILKNIFPKENYCELSVREIENTIKREILEKMLFNGQEPKYIEHYEKMAYAKKNIYMGEFIDNHYKLNKKYGNSKTGTITHKLNFANKIVSNINDINDLSKQAKNLCKKIYTFIKNSNC